MEFFQAFIIKTKACSQFYLENETQLSLRAKILTNSEFTCGQLHILSRAPSLNTSDTPVAAAQPGLKHGLDTNPVELELGLSIFSVSLYPSMMI